MPTEYRIKLAYDADSEYYKKASPLRINLLKFLLQNQAYKLKAYVGSTISFSFDHDSNPLSHWESKIQADLGKEFYYQISLVYRTNPYTVEFATKKKAKPKFEDHFKEDLDTAKEELTKGKIKFIDQ